MLCSTSARSVVSLATSLAVRGGVLSFSNMLQTAGYKSLRYDVHGEPEQVLQCQQQELPSVSDDEVEVKFLAAAVNPSDMNTIQGKYPIQPPLPAVAGHEGVGEVTKVGSKVDNLNVGDWVIPMVPGLGTWRQIGVFKADAWYKVPSTLPLETAATLSVNPPTALAMLESYVDLREGDVVVQNGATSAVGQAVIQIARAKGLRTVNVMRDRPNWDATSSLLRDLGADVITTETRLKEDLAASGLPPPKLALNCVGGSAGLAVAKVLQEGGTHVTYGGMGLAPLAIPTSLLIFKDLRFRGFWLSGSWAKQVGREGRAALLDRLVAMAQAGQLTTRAVTFPLSDFRLALAEYHRDFRNKKILLVMTPQQQQPAQDPTAQ